MKKLVLSIALAFSFSYASQAQVSLSKLNATSAISKVTSTAPTGSFDVKSIASQVVQSLQPKLNLTPAQSPQVLGIVTDLLNKKKEALPLMATDKPGYAAALSGIQSAFPAKMKTVLKAQQYASLLALIPKTSSSTNILSKLLF